MAFIRATGRESLRDFGNVSLYSSAHTTTESPDSVPRREVTRKHVCAVFSPSFSLIYARNFTEKHARRTTDAGCCVRINPATNFALLSQRPASRCRPNQIPISRYRDTPALRYPNENPDRILRRQAIRECVPIASCHFFPRLLKRSRKS